MLRIASTLTLGLLVLTGCPGDDTGTTAADTSTGPGATTTEAATETNPGTTVAATEGADTTAGQTTDTPMTTDTPSTTTDTPDTTTDAPETTTGEGTTTGGSMDVCAPDPADDECAMCVKSSCCMELEACQEDPMGLCQCFQECVEMNPGIPGAIQCGTDCMVNPLGPGPTGELASCSQTNCAVCLG